MPRRNGRLNGGGNRGKQAAAPSRFDSCTADRLGGKPMLENDDIQMMLEIVRSHLATMNAYLEVCMDKQDWHGVMDAAADIRELKVKEQTLLEVLGVK